MEHSRWNRDYLLICLIGFLSSFGTAAAETLVTKYAGSLGAGPSSIGTVSSVCSIAALLVLPFSAPLMDAYRKDVLYRIFAFFLAIAYAGFSFSSTVNALIFFRLINGIGKGVSIALCLAMAGDALGKENLSIGIVWFTLSQAISVAFAPTFGLYLQEHFGYQAGFISGAVLVSVSIVLTFLLKDIRHGSRKLVINLNTMVSKEAIMPALIMFFLTTAYSTVNAFLVVYAEQLSVENIGMFFTVYSLCLLASRPLVSILMKKIPGCYVTGFAFVCFGMAMWLISVSTSLPMFLLSAVISAFGYGILQPLIQSLCLEMAGEEHRGSGSTTSYIGTNLGYFVGPMIGGRIASALSYGAMYRMTLLPLAIGFCMYFINMNKNGKENGK